MFLVGKPRLHQDVRLQLNALGRESTFVVGGTDRGAYLNIRSNIVKGTSLGKRRNWKIKVIW